MADNKSNTDHLHEEGVLNKDDLSKEHAEAINSLSKEEIEQLKSMHGNVQDNTGKPVGIFV